MPLSPNFIERTLFLTFNQGPGPMLDLWSGPAFWTVHTALKLNIFETLADHAKTPDQVANAIQGNSKGVYILLKTLSELGYVKCRGDHYSNSPMTRKWLLNSGSVNFKPFFLYWGALMEHFMPRLPETVLNGGNMDLYQWIEDHPAVSRHFQEGMVQLARFVASDIAKATSISDEAKRVIDVGGGHGEYSIALCKAYPNLSAVIFDSEQALVTGREAVENAQMSERFSFSPGNFMKDDLPDEFDIALIFNIVHGLKPEQNIKLLGSVKSALNPGGQIMILEQVHNISPMPLANTLSHILSIAYYHLIGGQVYTSDQIENWLSQTGFVDIQRKPILKASSILLTAISSH
jgi:ubiquinone/menaquinone biosynthesis C-methylase UbiE